MAPLSSLTADHIGRMLPSFLRDSLRTVHREPQLPAHASHVSLHCQSVLMPLLFVHGDPAPSGVSIFLTMSFQGAIPVVCGASTWLAWDPAAQHDWELAPGFACPLFDTNFYSLNPIHFQLLPLIGKEKTTVYWFLSQGHNKGASHLLSYPSLWFCRKLAWAIWRSVDREFDHFHLEPKFYCQERSDEVCHHSLCSLQFLLSINCTSSCCKRTFPWLDIY